jgi:stage II sporulation SpoE-like protein
MPVRAAGFLRTRVDAWRTGSRESQGYVALALLVLIGLSFVVSLLAPAWMPLAAYFVWLLVAMLVLRFGWLLVVAAVNAMAGIAALALNAPVTGARLVATLEFVLAVLLVVVVASRQRSGLPATLSDGLLSDLKARLSAQGQIPALPEGWESQSAMIASNGSSYAGDFLVADLSQDGRTLEVILVDVCGKGMTAGPAALQFAGALGGLIGELPPEQLFKAANNFLLRQHDDESFATAVHLLVDLEEGCYRISSAGHPPALRWDLPQGEWVIDNARGTALGVLSDPELQSSEGRLFPGEALLFYTDGVVEARTSHIDVGIAWLQRVALDAVGHGFGDAASRIIGQVDSGEDDRAVLILHRTAVPSSTPTTGR